jgi:hypothetical protein
MKIGSGSGEGQNEVNKAKMKKASTTTTSTSSQSLAESKAAEAQLLALNKEKYEHVFKKLAKQMLEIESPSFLQPFLFSSSDVKKPVTTSNSLIEILIRPLEKRFKFHFFTARKTNNLDKVISHVWG